MDKKFVALVPHIKEYLEKHHELYSGKCKGEMWEEICAKSLKLAGFGTDWEPDFNHAVRIDQRTADGFAISNKSGTLSSDGKTLEISGSRLTKHNTLTEKVNYISAKLDDAIFCLASKKEDWKENKKVYYFVVVDSGKLIYNAVQWDEVFGKKGKNTGKVVGYKCACDDFTASISNSMSDQLWTNISSNLFTEIHRIEING